MFFFINNVIKIIQSLYQCEIFFWFKKNENKEYKNKIYYDNWWSFYIYKINKKYQTNTELINKLEIYQIFTYFNNKSFKENYLVYSMKQTWYFNNSILINIITTCFTKYINEKTIKRI